ncbi:unnamed protein product [Citrullus colocynthis]|uniref:Uncharacterized protein n=1 Tax=Citrullus colocynthis TaxID=252529 RepID=A0ABP0YBR4_9ROSI
MNGFLGFRSPPLTHLIGFNWRKGTKAQGFSVLTGSPIFTFRIYWITFSMKSMFVHHSMSLQFHSLLVFSYSSSIGFTFTNDLMESKGGKKKSSSSSSSKSLFYEAPLGYSIEDVRPHGGIKKFRSAAYSNCVRKPS